MLRKTYWILISAILLSSTTSCAGFPVQHRYILDLNAQVCTQWTIDQYTLKSIPNSNVNFPLAKCNGFVATDPADYVKEMQFDVNNCALKTTSSGRMLFPLDKSQKEFLPTP